MLRKQNICIYSSITSRLFPLVSFTKVKVKINPTVITHPKNKMEPCNPKATNINGKLFRRMLDIANDAIVQIVAPTLRIYEVQINKC